MTDANVVLGRLNPGYFLGGEIGLDVEGASRAIEERCAKPLGLSVTEAANGIVEIANAAMVNALHLISVQRGYDPRDFVLVGFGGAGPVHANALMRDAEMPTLLIPRSPGIFSATGLLTTDIKRDAAVTVMRRLDALDPAEMEATFQRLEEAGRGELEREGLSGEAIEFARKVDLRYVGQSYELDDPRGRRHDRPLPRRARPHLRLRRTGGADRGRQPAAHERRPDREATGAAARCGRRWSSRRSGVRSTTPSPAATSTARSTTATACPPALPSTALRSWRSSTPPSSSTRASRCGSTTVGNLVIEREHRGGSVSAEYGIVLSKKVMVPMRDGIRLAFDIYRPARDGDFIEGRFPTIMLHTPYDRTDKRYARSPTSSSRTGTTSC